MSKITIFFLAILFLVGCSNVPSSEELTSDIRQLENEINEVKATVQEYSGGLLAQLAAVRLETLQSTKTMLEQKKNGLRRYILVSYSVDGNEYSPPDNKEDLLEELNQEIEDLKNDLAEIEKESERYGRGLLGVLSLTQVVTTNCSIAFLEQKRLLLKHDIPYYSVLPDMSESDEPDFIPTPGEDIDKF